MNSVGITTTTPVKIGIMAFLSTCRNSTMRSGRPFGTRGAHVVAIHFFQKNRAVPAAAAAQPADHTNHHRQH